MEITGHFANSGVRVDPVQKMKPSISALAFLLHFTGSGAFGPAGEIRSSRHDTRLNYSDIEPELAAATIDPKIALIESALYAGNELSVKSPPPPSQVAKRSAASRVFQSREVSETLSPPTKKKRKSRSAATSLHEIAWNQRYNELVEYKKVNGDCLVPQTYKPNKKLGYWVMQQRRQYRLQSDGKRNSLDGRVGAKRKQLLDDIGFVWKATRTAKRLCLPYTNEGDEREEFKCEICRTSDFEGYMIERSHDLSDDEKRQIWLKRFELFR